MSGRDDRWHSLGRGEIPHECPFEPSAAVGGIRFTGRGTSYTQADTWYLTRAADGHMYSPWTDGTVDSWACGSIGVLAATGYARVSGSDPLDLEVVPLGTRFGSPGSYGGRYPCGSLVHRGSWYYGTYCLDESGRGLNWDVLGPFVGFRVSSDLGTTWTECEHTPESPIFGESGKDGGPVRFGAPHFVDFGVELEHSPDGKAYLVGHGGTRPYGNASWISGDGVHLCRVDPSPATINDPAAYEFFAGHDRNGDPRWSRSARDAAPLVEWTGHVGHATITHVPGLGRYLMCVTDGWPTISTMSSMILESESLTGPWRLVSFLREFGPQAYFLNLPSAFLSPDGRTAWLSYSANFTAQAEELHGRYTGVGEPSPSGSRYALCLQEFELLVA